MTGILKSPKMLVFLLTTASAIALCIFTFTAEPPRADTNETPRPALLVSVATRGPVSHPAVFTLFGQAKSIHETIIRPGISGRILWISPDLARGAMVSKGQVLAKVDEIEYQSKLAAAGMELSNADLALLKEEQEAAQAARGWDQSGLKGSPKSPLVLRGPQVKAAKARVRSARATLAAAKKSLEDCRIKAPFSGLIVSTTASPGRLISAGESIGTLYSKEKLEIEIHLTPIQWAWLTDDIHNTRVFLTDETGGHEWEAQITRKGWHILPESRLRQLFCEVENPLELDPPLLPGTFLHVRLVGRPVSNLLMLPESALTKEGVVWYSRPDHTLDNFEARPLFYEKGQVFLHPPGELELPLPIAVYPNTAFVKGLKIEPRPLSSKTAGIKG